jgi:uncharacterized membrane protein
MHKFIEMVAGAIEVLAVVTIGSGIVYAIARHFLQPGLRTRDAYKALKDRIGSSLLLGLEFLVAADIIRTVALHPTLGNVGALGVLIVIRTLLGWALVVEIEGRWPWQAKAGSQGGG